MTTIHKLPKDTIDKIAAGEVIERPASIVKELVENAIDAKAGAITVEIREGGISLLRVTDNGGGIDASQVRTAFLRHATSKISSADDLVSISTLGFRGEALASICAVSQMEVITKTPGALTGVRYVNEGAEEKSFQEIGAPEGSTFIVRNVFYNTPARKKFLKSAASEAGYISDLVEHLALSHPEISFKFISNSQTRLYTSGNGQLKDIIYSIYGRETASNLLKIEAERDGIAVSGFVGKPAVTRGNRMHETYFVNQRYVKSSLIAKALEDGFKGYLMQHRYPFAVLHITLDGSDVDINVHPAKMEVRFADQETVYELIRQAVAAALSGKELIPEASAAGSALQRKELKEEQQKHQEAIAKTPEPFERLRRDLLSGQKTPYERKYPERTVPVLRAAERPAGAVADRPYEAPVKSAGTLADKPYNVPGRPADTPADRPQSAVSPAPAQKPRQMDLFEDRLLSEKSRTFHRMIGQLFDTYWLIEFKDHLYIIDQHAAHEKVMYERLMSAFRNKEYTSQAVSPPILISLSMAEEQTLKQYLSLFHDVGFEISHFGGREYAISAVPDNLYGFGGAEAFVMMIDSLSENKSSASLDFLTGKLATMACKAAVKGNHAMSAAEADALIDELLRLDNPYHCPHGRPTIISMSKEEIEKKFKRIV